MSQSIDLAISFFKAAEENPQQFREICSPDMLAIQNGGRPMSLDTLIKFGVAVKSAVRDFRYVNAIRSETNTGFVEEHDIQGTLPDGSALNIAVCVVAEISEGRITHMREYLDLTAAAGLVAALSN